MWCVLSGNKCLKAVRGIDGQGLNWSQALDYCRSQPGLMSDLASISSEEEQSELSDITIILATVKRYI